MASSSKKKTTMAKMNREAAVRDKRLRKQAKKDARKLAALEPDPVETDETTDARARSKSPWARSAPPERAVALTGGCYVRAVASHHAELPGSRTAAPRLSYVIGRLDRALRREIGALVAPFGLTRAEVHRAVDPARPAGALQRAAGAPLATSRRSR